MRLVHAAIHLEGNEYYVVAGNEGVKPDTKAIQDYLPGTLKYTGLQEQMMLTTGFRNVYYIVPDDIYDTLQFPEYRVFAYELDEWKEKGMLQKR